LSTSPELRLSTSVDPPILEFTRNVRPHVAPVVPNVLVTIAGGRSACEDPRCGQLRAAADTLTFRNRDAWSH
jgi:hypothetical protein